MIMECRECGKRITATKIRKENIFVYVIDSDWNEALRNNDDKMIKNRKIIKGYDGCRGWP